MTAGTTVPSLLDDQRRGVMKTPDDVSAMLRLKSLGWGSKRIAAELGCARNTVRHWLAQGDWRPCASASRSTKLDGLSDWLGERFRRHAGNADVVRQELACEKGISVSLRTVERAVAPLRRELIAAARATVRFETQPGEQLQIDFGERRVGLRASTATVPNGRALPTYGVVNLSIVKSSMPALAVARSRRRHAAHRTLRDRRLRHRRRAR